MPVLRPPCYVSFCSLVHETYRLCNSYSELCLTVQVEEVTGFQTAWVFSVLTDKGMEALVLVLLYLLAALQLHLLGFSWSMMRIAEEGNLLSLVLLSLHKCQDQQVIMQEFYVMNISMLCFTEMQLMFNCFLLC